MFQWILIFAMLSIVRCDESTSSSLKQLYITQDQYCASCFTTLEAMFLARKEAQELLNKEEKVAPIGFIAQKICKSRYFETFVDEISLGCTKMRGDHQVFKFSLYFF